MRLNNLIRLCLTLILVSTFFTSCGVYVVSNRIDIKREIKNSPLEVIENIYIESFTGRDSNRLFPILIDEFSKRSVHKILDFPPERSADNTGILSVEIRELQFFENEIFGLTSEDSKTLKDTGDIIVIDPNKLPDAVRTNSSIQIYFRLRRSIDNLVIFEKTIGRSFQQVYGDGGTVLVRPDADFETDRLARLVFSSFAEKIDFKTKVMTYDFEYGIPAPKDFRGYSSLSGNSTIIKGIRYAHSREWKLAILSWLSAVQEPNSFSTLYDFQVNRAAAFYNIGQVYRILDEFESAASYYSMANQSFPRLHYAQFWADMVLNRILSTSSKIGEDTKEEEVFLETERQEKSTVKQTLVNINLYKLKNPDKFPYYLYDYRLYLREEELIKDIKEL